ncbi:hypothetical protein ACFOZ7_22245 [Natribaculum luteum]|uniref:DUF433 domain-containing protein n=1 Tax=Natribaculum luteum TaxID=1586232 RepID=A0ABD5P6R6_9EURY|nr:hypothetical protein [Natribaculum luteum]
MRDGRTKINFWVSEDEKAKFKEYAKKSTEFSDLSDLCRKSVYREMSDNNANDINTDEIKGLFEASLETTKRAISDIRDDMEVVKDSLSDPSDVGSLAVEIYDNLAIVDDPKDWGTTLPGVGKSELPGVEGEAPDHVEIEERRDPVTNVYDAQKWGDAKAWTEYLDASPDDVRRALSYCRATYKDVDVYDYKPRIRGNMDSDDVILRRYYRRAK